uniref:Cytochrome c biogenesis protein Ccs1 n=1 Tax=Actinocyclus subtilis TaxID=1630683 RepID=A0A2U9NQ74_9STRA|nr:c-type cytochrome biogenesis protein [Actinocyclus subtilis]AWT39269.1 c-type cytochrome biogenesis protein [Actinocyclus subtilis]
MKQQFLKLVADLRFAVTILLIIAFISIIGTIIEQDQSIETYKLNYPLTNKLFGILSWNIILDLGLNDVYHTWWFLFFICLFGISLFTCTFLQQLPTLKIARRCQFFRTAKQFYKLKISKQINQISLNQLLFQLKENKYSIFQQRNIVYCYKGLIGRLAPIIVHFSMILILFGTIIGATEGFKAQEIIPKTESFRIQNLLTNGKISLIPKTLVRVNDFWITYNKQLSVSQFYSDISFLNNNGYEFNRKTIFVNAPAIYKGNYFYQIDWNLIGLRINQNSLNTNQYSLINVGNDVTKIWFSWIPTNSDLTNGFTILINSLQGYLSIYDTSGTFIGNLEINETFNTNLPLSLIEIISSTGIQVKLDPGIPIIYSGFFLLMISTLISYITYSQIWIVQNSKTKDFWIGGNTTRAKFEFELEFSRLTLISNK